MFKNMFEKAQKKIRGLQSFMPEKKVSKDVIYLAMARKSHFPIGLFFLLLDETQA